MILYKYAPSKRIGFFENFLIRFSQAGDFNDIYESSPIHLPSEQDEPLNRVGSGVYFATMNEMLSDGFREKVLNHVKASFAMDPNFKFNGVIQAPEFGAQEHINGLKDGFRAGYSMNEQDRDLILGLTEDPSNHVMWSDHAESYKGFVVGFDTSHNYFHQADSDHPESYGRLHKVKYTTERPANYTENMSIQEYYLTKNAAYSYEREWRMINNRKFADQVEHEDWEYPIFLFRMPKASICEVILGYNMSSSNVAQISKMVKNQTPHVEIKKVSKSKDSFGLEFVAI